MKYFSYSIFIFAASLFFAPLSIQAEVIRDFDVDISIHDDGSITVRENITYDFENESRHGIYRDIDTVFKPTGAVGRTDITILNVTNDQGEEWMYDVTSEWGQKSVKIGDPDIYVTGEQVYGILYKVQNAIGFFENSDELYWNVTGNEWEAPIENVSVTVAMADRQSLAGEGTTPFDYCGPYGSDASCGNFNSIDGDLVYTMDRQALYTGEGVTIDIEFPKGYVAEPTFEDMVLYHLMHNWFIPLPLIFAYLLLRKSIRRYQLHRQFKQNHPRMVQYDPANWTLMEASFFHDGKFENNNLAALIVDFAIKGYVKIIHEDKKFNKDVYTIELTERGKEARSDGSLTNAQQGMLEDLDGLELGSAEMFNSTMRTKRQHLRLGYYKLMREVATRLKQNGLVNSTSAGLLHVQDYSRRFGLLFINCFLAVNPGVFVFTFAGFMWGYLFSATLVVTGIASLFVPRRPDYTRKGLEAEHYIDGLRWYIDQAESDRINALNQYAKTPELYERLLPYAIVFRLEKKWSKAFDGIIQENPSWYVSSTHFTPINFTSDIKSITSGIQSSVTRTGGSSGGGGFSGGGGGGGGGGSW